MHAVRPFKRPIGSGGLEDGYGVMIIFLDSERDDSDGEFRSLDLREVLRLLEGEALMGGGGFNLIIGLVGRSGGMGEGGG
ncbi:hypothetical protein GWI33_007210 [Rhynchophorus ferrugineus]|uniref:Uncharacterized protein n=1 Tax=Rhynchophorus ferrugineus TaxID=354439 RepID=A0A834IKL8_RHYFE|nr:hypothetical protein GWI33_007210 [Rhynchophorus ferrugineus]